MTAIVRFQLGQLGWMRYALSTLLCLMAIVGVWFGGWPLATSIAVVIAVGFALDELIGDELEMTAPPPPSFCAANLYLAAPALVLLSVIHMDAVARTDLWHGGALLEVAAATALVGYLYALIGATVGHELVHRTKSTVALVSAHILLAFTFNTSFAVFHLAGHHRYVAT